MPNIISRLDWWIFKRFVPPLNSFAGCDTVSKGLLGMTNLKDCDGAPFGKLRAGSKGAPLQEGSHFDLSRSL